MRHKFFEDRCSHTYNNVYCMTFQFWVYCKCLRWVMGQYPDHFVYVHRNVIMEPFNPTCLSVPRLCIYIKGMRAATQCSSTHVRSARHAGTMGNLSPVSHFHYFYSLNEFYNYNKT